MNHMKIIVATIFLSSIFSTSAIAGNCNQKHSEGISKAATATDARWSNILNTMKGPYDAISAIKLADGTSVGDCVGASFPSFSGLLNFPPNWEAIADGVIKEACTKVREKTSTAMQDIAKDISFDSATLGLPGGQTVGGSAGVSWGSAPASSGSYTWNGKTYPSFEAMMTDVQKASGTGTALGSQSGSNQGIVSKSINSVKGWIFK